MSVEAVPNKLSKVTVHGANIATTLYGVTAGGAPCDGLIFGETVTTTTQHLRDDDGMATVTESRAAVTATLCCAATCSFYDAAGELCESALSELTAQQPAPLLGWLSYRPASASAAAASAARGDPAAPLRPSMRESAVTLGLLRRQLTRHGGRQAVLLLLVSTGTDHNGATLTWQYRCFQARLAPATGEMLLEPVELASLNLGGHTGQAAYQELSAATPAFATASTSSSSAAPHHTVTLSSFSSAAALAAAPPPPGGGGVVLPGYDASALAAGSREQVRAVRQHCEAMLGGLHELCGQAVAGEAAVAALRRRRDALLAALARSQ